jgi:hypothetical protein
MTEPSGQAAVAASVLSLRMRGLVADPAQRDGRRVQLLAAAKKAVMAWDPGRRVVLESPDGLAFVGDVPPSVALDAAGIAAREAAGASLGIGLHHGRVEIVGEGDTPRLRGEGLEMAAALAGCSDARSIIASQSFREALAASAPRDAADLRPAGEIVDDHLRKHSIFLFDAEAARERSVRRTVLAASGLVLLLGAGLAVRTTREYYEAARRPGIIHLDIKPSGEVFVDGQSMGRTPPVLDLKLPPGPHSIEVRSGRFQPLRLDVQLQPGEEMQLKHVFAAPAAAPRRQRPKEAPADQPGFVDRVREGLGRFLGQ